MTDVTNRLLENPVEATTIVQKFVLLFVENVVWKKKISEIIRLISKMKRKKKKKEKKKKKVNAAYCILVIASHNSG